MIPDLNKFLSRKKFSSKDEIITQTNAYFEELDKSFHTETVKELKKRSKKLKRRQSENLTMELTFPQNERYIIESVYETNKQFCLYLHFSDDF